MKQEFTHQRATTVRHLSGPWWLNNTVRDPEMEFSPEEAFFRIEFSDAENVRFHLATSGLYQFWLNGKWMGCGPARAPHGRLTVDEWDLPRDAQREKNTIGIQVLWEGVFTFDHVRGFPGLWFSVSRGEEEVTTDLLITERTGRRPSRRFSHQRGWIEEIDGRQRASGWPVGPWHAADWRNPVLRSADPAVQLEARDIKPFTKTPKQAQSVSFVGSGDLSKRTRHRGLYYGDRPGFEGSPEDPSCVMQEEALEPSLAADLNLSALTDSGEGVTTLGSDARGLNRTVQLTFTELVSGTLHLVLEAPPGTIVDIGWSEGRWNDPDMGLWARSEQPGGSAPSQELNDARQGMRYICSGKGVETFHSLFLVSFQRVRLAFRCPSPAPIHLHDFTVIARGYPISEEGSFACSDPALERIYRTAIHTMRCSIDDVYLDCPGRERGGYPNDSYWTSLGFLDVTGDFAFDRRFLRQFFETQEELGGAVTACYPADSARWTGGGARRSPYVITGHLLFWLLQCERHLRLFGDAALKEQWRPRLAAGLSALEQYRTAEGLLENVPWDTYFDWSAFQAGPIQTGDNFLYALTLIQLGTFYENGGWVTQGRQTAETIESLSWNPSRELYADTVLREEKAMTPSVSFSAVMNYVALWTGLTAPEHARRAWRQLRDFRPVAVSHSPFDYETGFIRSNLVGLTYRFDYEGRKGEIRELIRDLREAYEPMFARGQTTFGEHLGYHGSLCHAYNGYVAYLLYRYIAGIELPETPGEPVRIRPHADILSYCQARVCWMGGHVQVWWSRKGDEVEVMVSLPKGQKGELVVGSQEKIPFTETLHSCVPRSPREKSNSDSSH